jgi:hypothetical protein
LLKTERIERYPVMEGLTNRSAEPDDLDNRDDWLEDDLDDPDELPMRKRDRGGKDEYLERRNKKRRQEKRRREKHDKHRDDWDE